MDDDKFDSAKYAYTDSEEVNVIINWILEKASPEEKVEACRSLYERQPSVQFVAKSSETGHYMFGSEPLTRAFVMPDDASRRSSTSSEDVFADIKETIRSFGGLARRLDPGFDEEFDLNGPGARGFCPQIFYGESIVGLFWSADTRDKATQEILQRWSEYGVALERTAYEWHEIENVQEVSRAKFDEDSFRRTFIHLPHKEKVSEIHRLWEQGINFRWFDQESQTEYCSVGAEATFAINHEQQVDEMTAAAPWTTAAKDSFSTEELRDMEMDQDANGLAVQRAEFGIRDIVARRGGQIDCLHRNIIRGKDGHYLRSECDDTFVSCRFPTEMLRDEAVSVVLQNWSMFGVDVDPAVRKLSLEERIEHYVLLAARSTGDDRERNELLSKQGPAFSRLKDQVMNAVIAEWEVKTGVRRRKQPSGTVKHDKPARDNKPES